LLKNTSLGFEINARKKAEQEIKNSGTNHKARLIRQKRLKEQFVENVDPMQVFERDNWICQLCNHPVSKIRDKRFIDIASLDHIIPLSKGGQHSYANTQLAHLNCNIRKGNRN
jgi:5-methylcytosine-specific restriction endonuclease McrA